ncbi:MAG TPA: hypothetical protein DEF30_00190 [Proteiniclasticum sp.]|uniref:DUF5050 domain-containing protein n=1 Tax=Proteiniclasticum sp. TaxID=2053595 RepID=UPI000E961344|nr:DUF5050 domain-containing protein [Proteiniclasticum sp.]HBW12248.1 hypothetical protein [Proteiniclasticum sp.]
MKKMWVFPFLMAMILIVAAGCGKSEPVDTPENEPKEEEPSEETPSESPETEEPGEEKPEEEKTVVLSLEGFGNTMSNIINDGMAVFEAPYLYHMDSMITGNILRTNLETKESEVLVEGQFSFLNYGDGTLFFAGSYYPEEATESSYGIFRMDTDGENLMLLQKGYITDLLLYDEYLYFFNSDEGGLFRLKYDGTEETLLVKDVYEGYALVNDMIYLNNYLDGASESYVYKLPLTGGTPEKVDEQDTFGTDLFPTKEFILYEPRVNGSRSLTRYSTENGQFSQLDKAISGVTEAEDIIYYYWSGRRQDKADQGIYKSKPDGTEEELILQVQNAFSLNYVNGKLYYHTNDEKRRISVLDPVTLEQSFLPLMEEVAP